MIPKCDLNGTLIVALLKEMRKMPWRNEETKTGLKKVKLAKRKWIAKNPLLAMDTEESLENIQHIGDHLAYLGKWQSVHNAGIHQSVLIPQRNSHGIIPAQVQKQQSHSSACPTSGGTVSFPGPMFLCSAKMGSWLWQAETLQACPMLPTSLAAKLGNNEC